MEQRRIALIPAYEPDEKMLALLPQLTAAGLAVVVVDDGSGPDYAPLFEAAKAYGAVLTHPENRGKGAALKTGYRWLLEQDGDPFTVVAVDADGQHRLPDVLRLCEEAEKTPDTRLRKKNTTRRNSTFPKQDSTVTKRRKKKPRRI